MKRLPLVILILAAVLVAVVTGCSGAHRYDARLVAADSLMQPAPDSALALIEALPIDSLTDEGDRAYRDLLLTQSRYRCYITATSDSGINRALSYYRAHAREREKLTRAFIYKGAVMEELGHPDSAMYYYKHAEATAAPDDYFNLGYSKLRIAELYQIQLSQDSAAIMRLKQAIEDFEILRDTNYLIVANGMLGAIIGTRCPDSAKHYLTNAINLSQQFKPSLQYTYKSKLAGIYVNDGNYLKANELAMDVMRNGRKESQDFQYYFYAALSFVKLNRMDSAKYILDISPQPVSLVDSMNHYDLLAEMALAQNDNEKYGYYLARSKDITSRILVSKKEKVLTRSEIGFDVKQLETIRDHSFKRIKILALFLSFSILLFILLAAIFKTKQKNYRNEIAQIRQELEKTIKDLGEEQKQSNNVSELVRYRISALNELYQDVRVRIADNPKTKKIIPLSHLFKLMNERNEILDIELSDSFWRKMKLSVDGEFNGIVSYVEKHYPKLTEQEMQLFCLICADISPQIIKLCMNYTNAKTVSNYRKKLIRKMTGQDMSFDEFVDQYRQKRMD